jgi:hypothetical protein
MNEQTHHCDASTPDEANLAAARGTATVFALVAACAIGMGLLTPAASAPGPVLGGVLFGASVAVPFWLASGLLLGLAPVFAWSGRHTHEPPSSRAAKAKLTFGSQEAR